MIDKKVSVVIPAYRCADTINKTIRNLDKLLKKNFNDYEIILVIDGKDRMIAKEARKAETENLKVFHYEANQGKGFAVKIGMNKSKGDIVGYIDGGGEINEKAVITAVKKLMEGYDIVCGSKLHSDSDVTNYTTLRKIYTRGYNLLLRILFGINYSDTQAGVKFYSRDLVKKVIPLLLVKKFAFEIEMLIVADMLGFNKHIDIPIDIKFTPVSNAANLPAIIRMLWDTCAIFYRHRLINYYRRQEKKDNPNPRASLNIKFIEL